MGAANESAAAWLALDKLQNKVPARAVHAHDFQRRPKEDAVDELYSAVKARGCNDLSSKPAKNRTGLSLYHRLTQDSFP
jgi:hypothetical protein